MRPGGRVEGIEGNLFFSLCKLRLSGTAPAIGLIVLAPAPGETAGSMTLAAELSVAVPSSRRRAACARSKRSG